jgi:hypothetical protein
VPVVVGGVAGRLVAGESFVAMPELSVRLDIIKTPRMTASATAPPTSQPV